MYGKGAGSGFLPVAATVGGIVVLPNTGGNHLLFFVSLLSTTVGSLILLSTAARFVAKKIYKS